jgi:N-acetylmuramoyl-L-alanine amidase
MATGTDLVALAKKHIGEKYVLGIIAPKDQADYKGPFDCAEFASYCVYQVTGKLYGCANNEGNPHGADAFSGFWGRDAEKIGKTVTIAEASRTPGSFVIRLAGNGQIGHVAMTQGAGRTVEANSTKYGLIESVISGRRWDLAVQIPWITYNAAGDPSVILPPPTIYRLKTPMMRDPFIRQIQRALGIQADGIYGILTFNAVKAFQIKHGLVPDGEVGPKTIKALKF